MPRHVYVACDAMLGAFSSEVVCELRDYQDRAWLYGVQLDSVADSRFQPIAASALSRDRVSKAYVECYVIVEDALNYLVVPLNAFETNAITVRQSDAYEIVTTRTVKGETQ